MQDKIDAYYQTQKNRAFADMEYTMLTESLKAIEGKPELRELVLAGESEILADFCRTLSFYPDLSGFTYTWLIRNLRFILCDGVDAFIESMCASILSK